MKNKIIFSAILLFFIISFYACENSTCKQCEGSSVIEQYIDGTLEGTSTADVSAIQYCDEELEMIEANSPISTEINQEAGGFSQRVVTITTYTCN